MRSSPLPLEFSLLGLNMKHMYIFGYHTAQTHETKQQLCDFLTDLMQENSNGNGADLIRKVKVFNYS